MGATQIELSPRAFSRCRVGIVVVGILLGLVTFGAPPGVASQQLPPSRAQEAAPAQTTALLALATKVLHVLGSDGLEHVQYDLIITNAFMATATLTLVEVLAPDGSPLLRVEGDGLRAVTHSLAGIDPTDQIPGAAVVATWIDLVLTPDALPERVRNRILYELPSNTPALIDSREIVGPALDLGEGAPIVISPPLRGSGWFNANGCCGPSPHRAGRIAVDGVRHVKPEVFAIDWLRLQDGSPFSGDGGRPEEWHGYGAEVLAVADGTVVSVNDGLPEGRPFQLPADLQRPVDYAGNQVVVQIDPGVWAIYAHLQEGSIKVQPGSQVTRGQPIALLGNTGNSFAPHLHFQLSDGPAILSSNSLPFVLDRYTVVGEVDPNVLAAAFLDPGGFSRLPVTSVLQPQTGTLPLMATVAEFP